MTTIHLSPASTRPPTGPHHRLGWGPILAGPILVGVGLLLAGCLGGGGGHARDPGSALWVDPEQVALLDADVVDQLAGADVHELFMPLGDLDLTNAGSPLERRSVPEMPGSLRLSVVVVGRLELGDSDPEDAADAVAAELEQLIFDVEGRGIVPAGVHFDLRSLDSLSGATAFFEHLRGRLDDSYALSLSLLRAWIGNEGIGPLLGSVDFVVPFLYGQRTWERDSDEAWSFDALRQSLARLEEYDVPYLVGIIGIGSATYLDSYDEVVATTSQQSMNTFMWNRNLKMQRGFSLEASNRRVYTLMAESPASVGEWDLRRQEQVRLVRPMTTDLDELFDVLAEGEYPHLVGQLYYRLPAPDERMSLTVENIVNALDPGPVMPELFFDVQVSRRTRRGAMYRFSLENRNGETTEYSLIDNNFLQITADAGAFGDVGIGDFYRYYLLEMQPDGSFRRTYRNANVVRMHVPIVEGHQKVISGDVEIHRRDPVLQIDAQFMMPDGRTVELGPFTWKDGVVHGQEGDEEADQGAEEGDASP